MKRIIIIINLFVLNLVISYGQNSCLTDNTNSPCCNSLISTDPRNNNASNLERPEYKNYFNWMTNKIWVYHPDGDYDNGVGNPIQIDNPFYTDDSYLRNINFKTFDLGYYDASKLDFYPEDGWELLHRNNGYQMNNQSILVNPSSAEDRAGPYFILYNKYTATIRLLGSFKGFGANDKMITTMSFRLQNSNVKPSALLSENGIVAQTLEETTKVLNVSQGSQGAAATEGNGWFVTDFKMGYDPCGCMNNSELNFKFSTNDDAKVTLGGRLIATSVPLGTDGTVPLINGNDYLLSVYKDGFDVKGGMLTYNNIDKLVSNYKSTYNLTDLEQTGINLLGDVLKAGLSGGIDPIFKWGS